MKFLYLISSILLNVSASVILKYATILYSNGSVSRQFLLCIILTIILYAMAFAAYGFSLRHFPVSLAYPVITGCAVMGVSLFGMLLYEENITITNFIGLVLICSGLWLVAIRAVK